MSCNNATAKDVAFAPTASAKFSSINSMTGAGAGFIVERLSSSATGLVPTAPSSTLEDALHTTKHKNQRATTRYKFST